MSYQQKTLPTTHSVSEFISQIEAETRGHDVETLVSLLTEITHCEPVLWGKIIGFGNRHYKYASGHEGDTMILGIASRKDAITLYGVIYYDENTELLSQLGKHKTGKGCLYINNLSEIDLEVLKTMIQQAYEKNK